MRMDEHFSLQAFPMVHPLFRWTPDPRSRGLWLWDDRGLGSLVDPNTGAFLAMTCPKVRGGSNVITWVDGERVLLSQAKGAEVALWSTSQAQMLANWTLPADTKVIGLEPESMVALLGTPGHKRALYSLEEERVLAEFERCGAFHMSFQRCMWLAEVRSRRSVLRVMDMSDLTVKTLAELPFQGHTLTRVAPWRVLIGGARTWELREMTSGEILHERATSLEVRLAHQDADHLWMVSAVALECWDARTLETLRSVELEHPEHRPPERATYLPELDALIVGFSSKHMRTWSATQGTARRGIPRGRRPADALVSSLDGGHLRLDFGANLRVAINVTTKCPVEDMYAWSEDLSRPPGHGIRRRTSPNGRYVCTIREDYEEEGYSSYDVFDVTLYDLERDEHVCGVHERSSYRDLDVLYVTDEGAVLFRWSRRRLVWWAPREARVDRSQTCDLYGPLYLHDARRIVDLQVRPKSVLRVFDADTLEELASWRVPGGGRHFDPKLRLIAVSPDARWALLGEEALVSVWDLETGVCRQLTMPGSVHAGSFVPGESRAHLMCEGHEVVTLSW